jgi:hypothetical protein
LIWTVEYHDLFAAEVDGWPPDAVDELEARALLLEAEGPWLKRPHADTLNGSRHSNMKELRFDAADGVWRVAFAFDPSRKAILLVGGDKSGTKERRFYKSLIARADARFDAHLTTLKGKSGGSK